MLHSSFSRVGPFLSSPACSRVSPSRGGRMNRLRELGRRDKKKGVAELARRLWKVSSTGFHVA